MDWSLPLLAACERTPRGVALRHRGESTSFAELEERVARATAALRDRDVAGRSIGWLLPTAPSAIVAAMALARAGARAVPLNPRLTRDELAFIVADAGIETIVAAFEHEAAAGALGVEVLALARLQDGDAAAGRPDPAADDRAVATVTYTSGTTGVPKGVMRTHRANAWGVVNSALGSPRTPADTEICTLPAFGIGMLFFASAALLGGATVVLDGDFDARRTWALLESERATRVFLAPTMVSSMLAVDGHEDVDLSALTTIYCAYEFPAPLRERAFARFGDRFAYMYGLTEAQLCVSPVGALREKPDGVGTAMGVARLRILGAGGEALPPGEVGEIAIGGPSTMSGYLGRAEETANALQDGWVRTGDLGRLDPDGGLRYAGRAKEMIKTGGFSVDPREVEEALLAVDGVEQAAAIGVPDDHWGEMIVAFVAPAGAVATDALLAGCRERLAGFKVPKRVLELDALPLNATGKVQRGELRERYASATG